MKMAVPLVLLAILSFPLYETSVSCMDIDSNYLLEKDYDACMRIIKSDINLDCGGFALKGTSYGMVLENVSSITIRNCSIKGFPWGIYANNSSLTLENTNLENSVDIFLYNSSAKVINSFFRNKHMKDSELWRYWFLNIYVKDSDGSPLSEAEVIIYDNSDNKVFSGHTGSNGFVRRMLPEYFESADKKVFYTNYTVVVSKPNFTKAITSTNMTENKDVHIILERFQETVLENITDLAASATIKNITAEIEHIVNATEVNVTDLELIHNITIPLEFENKTVRISRNISINVERERLKIHATINPEKPEIIDFKPLNRTVVGIEITVTEPAENSSMIIHELKEKPKEVVPIEQAYAYINISTEQIKNVSSTKIRFKVEKSWIVSRNLKPSEISLYRLENEWKELNTSVISQDEYYAYYEALSPGFSYFAIAVSTAAVAPVEIFAPTGEEEIFRIRFSWILVAAIIGLVLLMKFSPVGKRLRALASKKEEVEMLQREKEELKIMRDEALKKFYKRFITEQELKEIIADLKKREIEIDAKLGKLKEGR